MKRIVFSLFLALMSASVSAQQFRVRYVSSQSSLNNLLIGNSQRGGRQVEVNGYGFKRGLTVRLGDVYVSSLSDPTRYADGSDSVFGISPSHAAGWVDVVVTNATGESSKLERAFLFTPVGDTNGDGVVGGIDLVRLVSTLSVGTPDTDNGDVNEDGRVDSGDMNYLADFLFANGTAPLFNPPEISAFTTSPEVVAMGGGSMLQFAIQRATTWSVKSALANSINPLSGATSTTAATYVRDRSDGTDTVVLTSVGTGGLTTRAVFVRCPGVDIGSLAIMPSSLRVGNAATVTFAVTQATSWYLTSALGNVFDIASGSGSGFFSRVYTASREGSDTVTLTAQGPCGPVYTSVTVTVLP